MDDPAYQLATLVEQFIVGDIPQPSTGSAIQHNRPATETGQDNE
jgi:hypothetical protein